MNPCSGSLMDVASVTKEDDVSKQLSASQEGLFKRVLLTTRSSGINGQSVVLRMFGPIIQRFSKDIPLVPEWLLYLENLTKLCLICVIHIICL